jgi:hypothetical protein
MEKVHFEVKTVDGERREFEENDTLKLGELRNLCFDRFHIISSPGQVWVFQFEGRLLENMEQTLLQAGVKRGSILLFGTKDILGYGRNSV